MKVLFPTHCGVGVVTLVGVACVDGVDWVVDLVADFVVV